MSNLLDTNTEKGRCNAIARPIWKRYTWCGFVTIGVTLQFTWCALDSVLGQLALLMYILCSAWTSLLCTRLWPS